MWRKHLIQKASLNSYKVLILHLFFLEQRAGCLKGWALFLGLLHNSWSPSFLLSLRWNYLAHLPHKIIERLICEDPASFLLRCCFLGKISKVTNSTILFSFSGQAVFQTSSSLGPTLNPGPWSNTFCALHLTCPALCFQPASLLFVGYTGKQVSICLCPRAVHKTCF